MTDSGGVLVLNDVDAMDRLVNKNAALIERADDIPRVLTNFGGSSFIFARQPKSAKVIQKYLKKIYFEDNAPKLLKMLRTTVLQRLNAVQEKGKNKNLLEFNLTDEIVDTIGIFTLQTYFGSSNVKIEAETVKIYNDSGIEETMSFSVAYRTVYRQTMSKFASFIRVFLLDPLTEWCLTPFERRVHHNQNVIKQFLREKVAKHAEWRKKNPLEGPDDTLFVCDLMLAD